MGFFNWAAPLVRRYGDRFTEDDTAAITGWLKPYVPEGGSILDVGGGAGQLAAFLAGTLNAHATVMDPTPQMLSHVAPNERVTAIAGTAEAIPFANDTFDALITTDAFHHFRDQPAAVSEFARVVRSGGAVLVLDLDPTPLTMRIIVLGEKLLGEPGAFMTPEEMCAFMTSHGIDGECERLRKADYRFLGVVR
ncbi:MAG: class I SAM-dependent methyltransferase [Coriobacteriia bacterium]